MTTFGSQNIPIKLIQNSPPKQKKHAILSLEVEKWKDGVFFSVKGTIKEELPLFSQEWI